MSTARTTRSLAALAAFAIVAPAGMLMSTAASAAELPVKLNASAAPKIIDNPGSGNDYVRIVNVPNVRWSLSGSVDPKYGTPFSTSEKYTDVPVSGSTVTVNAIGAPGYKLTSDVQGWTLPFVTTETNVSLSEAAKPKALDYPSTAKDAISVTHVEGIVWTVNGTTLPAFRGTKTFQLSKLKYPATTTQVVVSGALAPGYAGTAGDTTLTFTTDSPVTLTTATVDAGIKSTLNLPGRTRDTITFSPIPGVKWSVCGSKSFSVTKEVTKSASCAKNPVPVTALSDKGYKIAGAEQYEKTVDFTDEANLKPIVIPDGSVTSVDVGGVINDHVILKPVDNIVWQYAYPTKPGKSGTPPLKWSKAPKAKAGSAGAVIKLKAEKGAETAQVYVRPVPVTEDFTIQSGWTAEGAAATDNGKTFSTATKLGDVALTATTITATDGVVTLPQTVGVLSWNVARTMTVAGKDKTTNTKVKVSPYTSVAVPINGAKSLVVTPVVDAKTYGVTGESTKSWTFPAAATTTTTP